MIGFIVFGLFVGVMARLLKPGRQNLSLLATLGLGLVGSVIGGVVANAARHGQHLRAQHPRLGGRHHRRACSWSAVQRRLTGGPAAGSGPAD